MGCTQTPTAAQDAMRAARDLADCDTEDDRAFRRAVERLWAATARWHGLDAAPMTEADRSPPGGPR